MKRITLAAGLGCIIIVVGISFLPGLEVRAMNVQVNIKDLPEYGVKIITSSDPSFDVRAQPFLKGQPEVMISRLKPVLAILENTGSLAIVGSCIKWEILKQDGTTFSRTVSSINARALMDGEPRLVQTTMGAAIPPLSIRFISVLGSVEEGRQLDLSGSWISFRGNSSEREEFQQALAHGNLNDAFNMSEIGRVLADATSITVSVHFVFFEDGTFVGDTHSDFFQTVNADVNARYDLAMEIVAARNEGATPEDIVNRMSGALAARAAARDETHGAANQIMGSALESQSRTYLDAYNRSRASYLRALIGMRDTLGAKEAISDNMRLLDKPRKALTKKVLITR